MFLNQSTISLIFSNTYNDKDVYKVYIGYRCEDRHLLCKHNLFYGKHNIINISNTKMIRKR